MQISYFSATETGQAHSTAQFILDCLIMMPDVICDVVADKVIFVDSKNK